MSIVITYKCQSCGNILHVKKGDDVPYKCREKAFRSSLKCGGLMVRTGEYKDEKVNHVR